MQNCPHVFVRPKYTTFTYKSLSGLSTKFFPESFDFAARCEKCYIIDTVSFEASTIFGFGLLNIGRLVHGSERWVRIPKDIHCEYIFNQRQMPQK
jgi:hypothetical protein